MGKKTAITFTGIAAAMMLAACTSQQPGFEDGMKSSITGRAGALSEKGDVLRNGGAVDAGRNFLGRNLNGPENIYGPEHGKPFPASLEKDDSLEIVTPEPVNIKQVELLLQELTGLNVVVRTRYRSGEESMNIPINSEVRINHRGSLTELVQVIASRFDLAWSFDGRTLTFDRMATRTYDVPLPTANGNIDTTLSGVNVAGNTVSSGKSISMDPWTEFATALKAVIEEPSTVTVSPNTGQVTIFAPASQQLQAAKIVKKYDELYSRRIGLEIATFFLDTDKTAELSRDIGISVNGRDGSMSTGNGLASALQGGIGVISRSDVTARFNFRNLAGSNALADYQMANTVAQNGVVAPVVLTNSKKYVSEITNETGTNGETSSEVVTDTINSGISIYALPRLMGNGKIHLSVWVTQSDLNSLETFDTGSGFVQLPDSDQRAVEYTLTMSPGETLVMGGYEQERASSSRSNGIGALGALGLQRKRDAETARTRMVMMIRPSLIGSQ